MNERDLARKLAVTFESLNIPYFITGSMASIAQGEPRFTNDIDVVVDLILDHVPALLAAFPSPDFYLSEQAARDAIARHFQFNIIHMESGLKIDVIVPPNNDFNRSRSKRIVRLNLDSDHKAWFASPEDVILKKLQYFQEGGSEKHLRDIAGLFLVQGNKIDMSYLSEWAAKLGVLVELQLVRERLEKK